MYIDYVHVVMSFESFLYYTTSITAAMIGAFAGESLLSVSLLMIAAIRLKKFKIK
jgi:hypothetical protein